MIVTIPVNARFNQKTLLKEQDFDALQGFVREVANRGMQFHRDRIVVDFRTRPGHIMVSSYPPAMWTFGMKTMNVKTLYDKDWIAYRDQLKRWKKSGGIKVRSQDPITGEVKTEKMNSSGIITLG